MGLRDWFADRLGWHAFASQLRARRVQADGVSRYIGGLPLPLLSIAVASGLLLLLYYRPGELEAPASVARISGQIPYGELIRAAHAWSSDLFIAALLAHLIGVALRRAYTAPRELLWATGLLLLIAGVAMSFTGGVLPWSQAALVQARIGAGLAAQIPLIGEWLRDALAGGEDVSSTTLHHAFGLHVSVLPAILTALIATHLFLLRRTAHSPPAHEAAPGRTIPFYPDFIVRQSAIWVGVVALVIGLSIFSAAPVGEPADLTITTPPGARPPWYFLPVDQLLRLLPAQILGLASAPFVLGTLSVLFAGAFALPFADRHGSRLVTYLTIAALLAAGALTVHALV